MRNLQTITVGQYQALYSIHTKEGDELDKAIQSVSVLTGLSENGVEDMLKVDFDKACREIVEIMKPLKPGRPKSFLKIAGKRYGVIYTPDRLTAGQYVEIQTWMQAGMIENIHKIFTSLLYPVKGVWPFWYRGKGINHVELSEKVMDCRFADVYNACVFFSKLWNNSINSLVPYLEKEMKAKGMNPQDLQTILNPGLAGYSAPKG